ncbi:hypothetical protein ACFP4H_22525 [Pseudophaeobacter arcticus]|uniref:hypothetical protein n=1 Tax=Pseudophaeobacter arcticus TaxID=385492 RepID=UPI0004848C97|nr:hypothetical protein [Pseudophaeobacter arcticus]
MIEILETMSPILGVITTVLAVYIAWMAFAANIRFKKHSNYTGAINQWQTVNQTILGDDNLLEIERENHPFGTLTLAETKKMYHYFCSLNIARNALVGLNTGHLEVSYANFYINNCANISFKDRDFIRINVFPRGYPVLRHEIEKRWELIEKEGNPICQERLITSRRSFVERVLGLVKNEM